MLSSDRPSVCLGTLIRNCAWILPAFLSRVSMLDYPKRSMDLIFLVNDSTDDSGSILELFASEHRHEYRSIVIARHDLGERAIGSGSSRLNEHDPLGRRDGAKIEDRPGLFRNLAHLRNVLVELFTTRTTADWLFSCDSDILIPADCLTNLLDDPTPRLRAGLVVNDLMQNPEKGYEMFHRRCNAGVIYELPGGRKLIGHQLNYELGRIYPVAVTGACFVCHRSILGQSEYRFHEWGEDAGFCLGLPEGTPIEWDTRTVCTHAMSAAHLAAVPAFESAVEGARALCRR